MNPTTIYSQLESVVLPVLESYPTDLTQHDRAAITDSTPFLHWARSTGTHLTFLPAADSEAFPPAGHYVRYLFGSADRDHLLSEIQSIAAHFINPVNTPAILVHYFDGAKLRRIDSAKAHEIARDYRRRIEAEWRAANRREGSAAR